MRPGYEILIKIKLQVPVEILVLPTGTRCKESKALFYNLSCYTVITSLPKCEHSSYEYPSNSAVVFKQALESHVNSVASLSKQINPS